MLAPDAGGRGRGGGGKGGGEGVAKGGGRGKGSGKGAVGGATGGSGTSGGGTAGGSVAPRPVGGWAQTCFAGGAYNDGHMAAAVTKTHFEIMFGFPKVSVFFDRVTLEKVIVGLGCDPSLYNLTLLVGPVYKASDAYKYIATAGGSALPVGLPVAGWFKGVLAKPALDMTKTLAANVPKYFQ